MVAAGNWHSMLIDTNGKILAAGHNKQGACGNGSFDGVETYCPVQGQLTAKNIACGDCYSLILTTDDQVFPCGHHDLHSHKIKGHLNKPERLEFQGEKMKCVAAGFSHSLAVTQKGQAYSWGCGDFYQLGHGDKQSQKTPKAVKKLEDVRVAQVSCTRGEKNVHSMGLSQEGVVYTWGAGYKGKLGHESSWSHENPADQREPRRMGNIDYKVALVSGGGIHSNILNENGEVLSFGCGSNRRLGHEKSNEYVYLYREGFSKQINSLQGVFVTDLQSSYYYHNICIGYSRQ